MRTRNIGIFLLAALFCGAFLCASTVSAKVCFVGDTDCGSGAAFGPIDPLPTEDLCNKEGYTTLTTACTNPGGVCPYDARYVKCCGAQYAYGACVFPLETVKKSDPATGKANVDKCGKLYNCKCNSEYKTPAEWGASTNKCQPGGGVCIMSNNDTVYYNKCVCDTNYFPYRNNCPADTTEIERCKDSDGVEHVSCQCPKGYKTCTYGPAAGAKECKQGGIYLYNSCKTPEQECINAGYFSDCHNQRCYYDTQNMEINKSTYGISCENSNEVCPYMFGYYFCRWSPLNFCKAKHPDMTQEAAQVPTKCTKDGIEGTVIPCKIGYDGEGKYKYGESTDRGKYLGYYRCKLTCEQQLRGAFSQGYLLRDDALLDDTGQAIFYRNDSSGNRHAYLINDMTLPKNRQGTTAWDSVGSRKYYASVNGIAALYDVDPVRYSSCKEERDNMKRPKLKLDHKNIQGDCWLLDTNLSDITVNFFCSGEKNGDCFSENYYVQYYKTWNNVTFDQDYSTFVDSAKVGWNGDLQMHYMSSNYTRLHLKGHLTITGDVKFYMGGETFKDASKTWDPYNNRQTMTPSFRFEGHDRAVTTFKNANIYTSGAEFYNNGWGTYIFDNSKGNITKLFGYTNVGFKYSTIQFGELRTLGWRNNDSNASIGGNFQYQFSRRCHGIYLYYSDVTVDGAIRIGNDESKMYVSYGSTFTSPRQIVLRDGRNSEVCASGKVKASSFSSSSSTVYWAWDGNTCLPAFSTNCRSAYYSAGSGGSYTGYCYKNDGDTGFQCWLNNEWLSACTICGNYGMGYNQ